MVSIGARQGPGQASSRATWCPRSRWMTTEWPRSCSGSRRGALPLRSQTGEILTIFGDMDDDGFFMAELGGRRGLVPSNFLTDLPPGYSAQPRVLGQHRL